MKRQLIVSIMLFIMISGCVDERLPTTHTTNLKEQHDYELHKIQGRIIYYNDDNLIKHIAINDDLFLMESNRTYLHYERYGGLLDFEQWTLYIKR